jgi:hypothetical protein
MIGRGANNFNEIAVTAADGGHFDIVEAMIGRGANNFNELAKAAARGGNLEIVRKMILRGARDFQSIIDEANEYNRSTVSALIDELSSKLDN